MRWQASHVGAMGFWQITALPRAADSSVSASWAGASTMMSAMSKSPQSWSSSGVSNTRGMEKRLAKASALARVRFQTATTCAPRACHAAT